MSTTSDRLALLQRTKAGQRALLEGMYPDLDFSTVPFREYGRLFTGRKYVPGFVGGWKGYGRSNSEDPATRDILPDYSGNGRDIKLYNFDFTESSGYSGGGLVSDGIDDYGQCIKGFSLPDDYTVVAIRKYPNGSNDGMLLGKINTLWSQSAFCFEHEDREAYSFGTSTIGLQQPALFSYQTKNSYNGTTINFGDASDTDSNGLYLFHTKMNSYYKECVLYDLRIYDHSLSAEELHLVKDEMMSDYEKATGGGIADIHYVADWDAKGRSNDEDADVRNKWIDKATGKVINLNNFAYAGMSGWNGYGVNFSSFVVNKDNSIIDGNKIYMIKALPNSTNVLKSLTPGEKIQMTVKVTGLTEYVKSGTVERLTFYTNDKAYRLVCTQDGIYNINFTATSSDQIFLIWVTSLAGDNFNLSPNIVIEQLPLYPGALVGDGIDDSGVTEEAIDEEVGTMLAMLKVANDTKLGSYFLNCGKNDNANRLYCWVPSDGIPKMGLPSRNITLPMGVLTRTPASPSDVMYIATYSGGLPSKIALYHLILIQEQLDGAQVEFLKWKVEKEYRDWCRANGYEYAINQLTA